MAGKAQFDREEGVGTVMGMETDVIIIGMEDGNP